MVEQRVGRTAADSSYNGTMPEKIGVSGMYHRIHTPKSEALGAAAALPEVMPVPSSEDRFCHMSAAATSLSSLAERSAS